MQSDNEKMLQEIVQNTEMGKNTLDELMSLTHDQKLKDEMLRQKREYRRINQAAHTAPVSYTHLIIVCRWGMGALGASTDLNSRMAWLQAGLDGPMYDATVENLTHSWQMLGLISVVCLVAAWLVLQIAFDKKKA